MLKIAVDVILVAVVLIGIILGWRRGFVGIVAKPVKFAASLGISFGFARAFSSAIILPMIESPASNYVREFLYKNCSGITAETAADELPTLMKMAAAIFGIDINQVAQGSSGSVIDAIADKLTHPVISTVSIVISFFALLIISNIALAIALAFIKSLFKKGILGAFNKVLGVVFGLAFFFIISWGLAVIFELIINLPSVQAASWAADFEGGYVYSFLNEYNPIELLLSF